MTKQEVINEIAKKTGIDKVVVGSSVESLMEKVKDSMIKGNNIYLRGFGTFLIKKRAKKTARNITKNTAVIIPEHFVPTFKPSKEFMASMKKKKV
jgi:DNA-binding protein HU-beta